MAGHTDSFMSNFIRGFKDYFGAGRLIWENRLWRWLIVPVVLVFAFNRLAGLVVGLLGLIAVANRVVGRVLKARRVVQQLQQIVTNPDDFQEEVEP